MCREDGAVLPRAMAVLEVQALLGIMRSGVPDVWTAMANGQALTRQPAWTSLAPWRPLQKLMTGGQD